MTNVFDVIKEVESRESDTLECQAVVVVVVVEVVIEKDGKDSEQEANSS